LALSQLAPLFSRFGCLDPEPSCELVGMGIQVAWLAVARHFFASSQLLFSVLRSRPVRLATTRLTHVRIACTLNLYFENR